MSKFEFLEVAYEGPVARVQFNRPEVANALSIEVLAEIEQVCLAFRDDIEHRVVVFIGAGKHFSSGADLNARDTTPRSLLEQQRRNRMGERATNALLHIDQITIAAWGGAAMGGGAALATACDLRIGAQDCFMQYPEIDIGMNLMWQSLPLITHLVGPARAKRLVAGGERIEAQQLLDWGVLDALVDREDLLPTAMAWAERYAAKPPIAAQMIKRSVNHLVGALDRAIMHMDADQNLLTQRTEDRSEAIKAYLEKRPGTFEGN